MAAQSFRIDVQQSVLDDLKDRLLRTRWAGGLQGGDWKHGTDPEYLKKLCAYWRTGFDWPSQQTWLNSFQHFRADVDGVGLHFIRQPGTGAHPMPLLLVHGWPDSFARFLKIIPLLANPSAHGADASDAFDVVVRACPAAASPTNRASRR
jgi:microsomal epoxide hydrolase